MTVVLKINSFNAALIRTKKMLPERKWSMLLSSEANNVYDKEFHLFEFLMPTFSSFGGQLKIRKKKRQRK